LSFTKPKKGTLLEALARVTANVQDTGSPVESIIVEVEPELYELTVNFAAHKLEDVKTILSATERGDFDALRALGHTLKGEGVGFGMDRISEIGAALEQAGKAKDAAAAQKLAHSMKDYLERAKVVPSQESANGSAAPD